MPVSLTTAKPGDRFEARDGEVWVYERRATEEDGFFGHLLQCGDTVGVFNGIGRWGTEPASRDLIRALDSPAPAPAEPMGDVGHRGEFGQAANDTKLLAWLNDQHARLVAQFPDIEYIAGSSDTIYSVAAARIEALTAALDEARKVIAQAEDALARSYDVNDYPANGETAQDEAIDAARDWHSKHGRAADA